MIQINVFQNRSRLTDIENKLMVSKGEGKRNKLGVWDLEKYILLYIKQKNNKNLLIAQGTEVFIL